MRVSELDAWLAKMYQDKQYDLDHLPKINNGFLLWQPLQKLSLVTIKQKGNDILSDDKQDKDKQFGFDPETK